MSKNRFEQVDEPQPDAITLVLKKKEDIGFGAIHCPAALSGGRLPDDNITADLPLIDAFRSAIRLANEVKAPLVVADPDGLWQREWGVLYRAE